MTKQQIREAPKFAMRNMMTITGSPTCGCYHCMAVIPSTEVIEWTDGGMTAICPKCGTDTLLPQSYIPLDEINLKMIHDYWFSD